MRCCLWWAIIFVIVSASPTVGQSYYFRHYQVENGLSHNTVFSVSQDKNGFLWFGTKDGLNRFDGYHFKLFNFNNTNENALTRDQISCLLTDSSGQLWAGGIKGLFKFDSQQEKLVPFIDTMTYVHHLLSDTKGRLWFIAGDWLCYYDHQSKKLNQFSPTEHFPASSICQTEDGTIWVSSSTGYINRYNESTRKFTSYDMFSKSTPAASRDISKLYPAGNNSVFAGTSSQGLKLFNTQTGEYDDVLTYNADNTTIFVHDILRYSNDEFWIGTESGIFILKKNAGKAIHLKKRFLDPYSISDNAIYKLYKDMEGGVWAGTYFGGVNYYPKQHASFQKYFPDYTENSISGNIVREICEDKYGNLWLATEDAGLNKLNPVTGEIVHFEPTGKKTDIAYSNIHGLLPVGDHLWIGTFEHGLDIMDIRTGKVIKHYTSGTAPNDLKSNFIVTMLETRSGSILLGTSNGLMKYDPGGDDFVPIDPLSTGLFIADLLEDHRGIIWVATHSAGVFSYDPATGYCRNFSMADSGKNGITTNTVNALYEDSEHRMWFATEGGGVCSIDEERTQFRNYSTKNGLPSNFIFKVLEDDRGSLWISTSKGLANMNPDDKSITVYTKENGLLNDQFNYNSGYKSGLGRIYMGSVRGMVSFDPVNFYTGSSFISPIYITGFQIDNRELPIRKDSSVLKKSILFTDRIVLPHDQSSFSIDFAALGFTSPERTQYSYMMLGLDQNWTNITSNRKVYFTNLSPGQYEFKVRASNNILQSKSEKTLHIKILPPFWATWWAYLVYIVTVAALLLYVVRSYHQLQEDKKEREIYKAKIDFFTNLAHEIRTPLTLIKGPVENLSEIAGEVHVIRDDVKTMERNTTRLVNLVNQILDFRQTEMKGFSLDFSYVNISEVLAEAYLTFEPLAKKRKLDYKLDVPSSELSLMADEEALQKIFSNLFSNAVKYAVREVFIKIHPPEHEAGYVEISVMNDGYVIPADMKEKIFEPFFRLKETHKTKGTGIGLTLARSLVELHRGKLYLKDPANEMNIFVVRLPFQNARAIRNSNKAENPQPEIN